LTSPHSRTVERASIWMLASALAFATMAAFVHALESRCDWLLVALIRALMMLVTAATLARASGSRLAVWRPRTLWVRSLAGSFSLVCNFYALARLPVADAVTLTNVHPLWIVLITAIVLRRAPTQGEFLGVASGLIGVALIEQPHLGVDQLAALVALLSSVSTAVAMLGLHRLRDLDARSIVAHFAGVASLISAVWLLLRRDPLPPRLFEPLTVGLLLGVGISGTLGQVLLTKAYAAGAPTRVAVVGLTQVIFAMGFDVAIWGRALTPPILAGFVLVMAPSTWLSLRAARKMSAVEPSSVVPLPESSEIL
jgi:drug/metabolite transporter (DMT)-like permease